MKEKIKVLIVDDNKQYRDAFRRNLLLKDYDVCEAENADDALQILQSEKPDIVVTDLQMRTRTEGLDLIRRIKKLSPLVPTVMISAIGTFEEGALASQFGASYVISKSRIEDEIYYLYETINNAYNEYQQNVAFINTIDSCRDEKKDTEEARVDLRNILDSHEANSFVKSEAYDVLLQIETSELQKVVEENLMRSADETEEGLAVIEEKLGKDITSYQSLDEESKAALRSAEFFFVQHSGVAIPMDLSRNIGFSFCFAVENEVKIRLKKKLTRFLADEHTYKIINRLLDSKIGNLDIFFHQYLLRLQHGKEFDFTIDNVKRTFYRILEHKIRYKPDGLKALGIIILCFGRQYEIKKFDESIAIKNPLGLKGIESEEQIRNFVDCLVSLQHYRNPYIHPEISQMKKVSKIRETAFECLRYVSLLV